MRTPSRATSTLALLASGALLTLSVFAPAQRGGGDRGAAPAPGDRAKPAGGEPSPAPGGAPPTARGESSNAPSAPELPIGERAPQYFAIADYNANGRLSFDEARKSLGVDRGGFAVYDKDGDGLIDAEEFRARYEVVLSKGGAFQPPVKKPETRKPPRREAPELLEVYDQTHDESLDEREVKRALADYEVKEPPVEELFATLDRDASRALEVIELEALADLLSPLKPGGDASAGPKPKSVIELFGRNLPREEREGAVHLPPQIRGPVPTFRRLDLDDDGLIELDDLTELQRPVQVHVRMNAVFSALDFDGDGKLSPDELRTSMRPRR